MLRDLLFRFAIQHCDRRGKMKNCIGLKVVWLAPQERVVNESMQNFFIRTYGNDPMTVESVVRSGPDMIVTLSRNGKTLREPRLESSRRLGLAHPDDIAAFNAEYLRFVE